MPPSTLLSRSVAWQLTVTLVDRVIEVVDHVPEAAGVGDFPAVHNSVTLESTRRRQAFAAL